jgi:hypothetical protein
MVAGNHSGKLSGAAGRTICILALVCRALLPRADHTLSAQSGQGVSIFIPEVTGTGSGFGDAAFFTQMLAAEVMAQNCSPGETRRGSRYSLNGSISFAPAQNGSLPPGGADPSYVLHLALVENATNTVLVEQELIYSWPEDARDILPLLVFTMLANIPPQPPPALPQPSRPPQPEPVVSPGDWRQKWWYFSACGCWTPRVYMGTFQSVSMTNFGFGLGAEMHFLNFMSAEAGMDLAQDWVMISPNDVVKYRSHVLEIPVLLKLVLKPASYFMLEPYGGIQFNIPLNELTSPPLLAWAAGLQYGVKAGPGAMFVDARFVMDIGDSTVTQQPGDKVHQYQRYAIKMAAGYKMGVFPKRKNS